MMTLTQSWQRHYVTWRGQEYTFGRSIDNAWFSFLEPMAWSLHALRWGEDMFGTTTASNFLDMGCPGNAHDSAARLPYTDCLNVYLQVMIESVEIPNTTDLPNGAIEPAQTIAHCSGDGDYQCGPRSWEGCFPTPHHPSSVVSFVQMAQVVQLVLR